MSTALTQQLKAHTNRSNNMENRYDRIDYLLETTTGFNDNPQGLLEILLESITDQQFDDVYQGLCRVYSIEPDINKFNEQFKADVKYGYYELQGTNYTPIQKGFIDEAHTK
jgi:hypothetical protein